jgi:hypothetical protein
VQKDAFLSQVSHELRTPMTSIRAFSEILRDSERLSEQEQVKYASIIHDEALRLTRLLDDLLDLSVLEHGQVSLNIRQGSLTQLLDHAVATAATGTDQPSLVVRREPTREAVSLTTDLDRLSQVFINLIANARKYCDAEVPELVIRVTRRDDSVLVDFIDNGSGISKDDQAVIFEKFARVGAMRAQGAGLGLAICREIMVRLGGSVSYLPGQGGAAFRVILPKRAAKGA